MSDLFISLFSAASLQQQIRTFWLYLGQKWDIIAHHATTHPLTLHCCRCVSHSWNVEWRECGTTGSSADTTYVYVGQQTADTSDAHLHVIKSSRRCSVTRASLSAAVKLWIAVMQLSIGVISKHCVGDATCLKWFIISVGEVIVFKQLRKLLHVKVQQEQQHSYCFAW